MITIASIYIISVITVNDPIKYYHRRPTYAIIRRYWLLREPQEKKVKKNKKDLLKRLEASRRTREREQNRINWNF